MRSKEVDDAIDTLQNCIADYVIGDFCVGKYCPMENECEDKDCPFNTAIDKVVAYISELEAKLEFKQFGDLDNAEFENLYVSKDKIRNLKEKYEKKCAVLGRHSDNLQWYEMGKIFGKAELCEEILGGEYERNKI